MAGSPIKHERNRMVREAILLCRDNPEQTPEDFVATWMRPIVKAAQKGDVACARELNDRLDGKPAQQVQLSGDENAPLKIIHESK